MAGKVKNILKRLLRPENQEDTFTPGNTTVFFELKYHSLLIGVLSLEAGEWTFRYSDAFKQQDEVKPLIEFPDIEKVYTSEDLSPLFLERIPGLGQPKVQEIIRKEKIDQKNMADLLKRFGRVSITNPFRLEVI